MLVTIMIRAIHGNYDDLGPGTTPPEYSLLLQQQAHIGWVQVFYGRLSLEWVRLHELARKEDGEKWASGLLVTIWNCLHRHWIDRCNVVHKRTESLQREFLENRLRHLYSHVDALPANSRDLLHTPLHVQLRKSTSQITSFLDHTEPLVQHQLQAQKAAICKTVHPITKFFRSIHPDSDKARPRNTNAPKPEPKRKKVKPKLTGQQAITRFFQPKQPRANRQEVPRDNSSEKPP